jgi:argininosuccinate synthase
LTTETEEGYEVVAFLANVGQVEDWKAVEAKALKIGAKKMIIDGTSYLLYGRRRIANRQQICKKSSLRSLHSGQ